MKYPNRKAGMKKEKKATPGVQTELKNGNVQVTVYITRDQEAKLRKESYEFGIPKSEIVRKALDEYFKV